MAMALKFEPIQPNWNMAAANRSTNSGNGTGPNSDITNQIVETMVKPISAPCDRRRMPKRITSREFRNDDTAIMPAMAANSTGNQ